MVERRQGVIRYELFVPVQLVVHQRHSLKQGATLTIVLSVSPFVIQCLLTTETNSISGYCFGAPFTLELAASDDIAAGKPFHLIVQMKTSTTIYLKKSRNRSSIIFERRSLQESHQYGSIAFMINSTFINSLRTSFHVPGWYDH